MVDALRRVWWATLIVGIVAIVIGLIAVFKPVGALTAVIVLAAIYAVITGLLAVIAGIRSIAHDAGGWLELMWGVVGLAIGLYVIFEPQTGAVLLFLLYGIWAILRGVVEIVGALRVRRFVRGWVAMVITGIAWALLGVLFLIAPSAAAVATTIVWGFIVLFIGIATVVAAILAHGAIDRPDDESAPYITM